MLPAPELGETFHINTDQRWCCWWCVAMLLSQWVLMTVMAYGEDTSHTRSNVATAQIRSNRVGVENVEIIIRS